MIGPDVLFKQGLYQQALQKYLTQTQTGPILMRIGEYTQAIEYLNKSLSEQDCDKRLVYFNLGNSLRRLKQYEQAITAYQQSIFIGNSIDTQLNLAICYRRVHRFTDAAKCYDYVLNEQPNNELAMHNKAFLFLDIDEPKKAIQMVNRVIMEDGKKKEYYTLKQQILKKYFPDSEEIKIIRQIKDRWHDQTNVLL